MIKQRTHVTKVSEIKRKWHILDASGQTLGRLASQAACLLRGKNKVNYSPSLDMGDFVVVINTAKIKLTGNKLNDKMYRRFTGYLGGMKEFNAEFMLQNRPEFMFEQAVRCMLPKGPLGRDMLKKLKLFADANHTHAAQKPAGLNA